MARIDFRHIDKRYAPGQPLTIKNVTLGLDDGQFCVFVGPSGCGKSTLLRLVAGLEAISSGDLEIAGKRVNDVPPAKRGVAMVFQSYALYPHMTVAENMAFGLRVRGADSADIERRVKKAATTLQLEALLDRLPKALSGGQRQRVAIGRAIVKEPEVFLFDEPLSNLDAALRVQTRLEIAKLHREVGRASTIYVTHDQVEAMTLADRIVLLRAGEAVQRKGSVAQYGTPMALYHRPANRFVAEFIGSPKMNVLPGRLVAAEPGQAIVDVGGTRVAAAVDARRAAPGATVALGIRPEHLVVGGDDAAGTLLPLPLRQMERLGDSSLLYLEAGPGAPLLTLRVDGAATVPPGTRVPLRLPAEACHLFDADGEAFERTPDLPV
ncbi:ABC transporter [Rubrivivax gelatinosus]|uniref:ABC transporter n=1 Tax=Rubrivivax gelatinosus TaxID=28068 RepID=A0ABS1DVR3_RUBGE|nr:sn-glycerol-3-phosphate ABC transporter ATP-binding protein UgpC [Rubrivivax gelatinosus]MBK1614797.1 ABC transporter [Rubrivivax gelatinosus]MBK1713588.1 ABC transporter [Rubrivivax gelatinosus]